MSFYDQVDAARVLLERNGRISLRGLQRELELDDAALDELIDELVDIQQIATRDGKALVWSGAVATALPATTKENAPASAAAPSARAPMSYTPKHLADRILQSRSALEGERKQVTVLFADVKGSMELAEQLDPEEWHRILERFFATLTDGVHRFEGTVNQYTGDGIMALFGAPIAHEDHAQRACYAALHLREALLAFSRDIRRAHGLDFSTRMGINSGDVVVGRIGDDLRMDYTAQGLTVGLAQRMESLAEPNTCFLTGATAAVVSGYFALEDLGEFTLKGVAEPVHVHRLIGVGTARTRFDISRAKGLSRFVGRAADMRTLEDAVTQTASGNGQVVGVVADAGTGKSRLCFEFLESCRARGMRVYEGHAVAHGKNIPLLPILELFRAWFGITTQDDDRSVREKIAGRMVVLDQTLAESLPLLYDFLGVADPQRPAPTMSPDARQRQLFQVMRQVIKRASETEPMVTLIEDLHWIDAASGEFLAQMVDAQPGTRNLLLVNFRPEYRAEWMQKSWYRQIPLTPLGREAIAELLIDLLGNDPSLALMPDAVHTRSAGNPFFAEEITQSLIELGQLQGTRGAYRLVTSIDRLNVPATVQAVLAARIDRLPEREKRLLQTASVIGKDFSEPLLEAVAELPPNELKEALTALRRAEFLLEQAIYPVVEYTFKHPLTQEVALGSQLKERRVALHARVARVIEATAGDRDEHAPLLAHHWEQAGELAQAVRAHARAATWAGSSDPVQGLRHWMKVRSLGGSLDDPESRTLRLRACTTVLGGASFRFDLNDTAMQECLTEARDLSTLLQLPQSSLAASVAGMATGDAVHGRGIAALAWSAEAVSLLEPGMDRAEELAVRLVLGWLQSLTGSFSDALATDDEIVSRAGGDIQLVSTNDLRPASYATYHGAMCLACLGRFDGCWPRFERGLRLAREPGPPDDFVYSNFYFAQAAFLAGGAKSAGLPDLMQQALESVDRAVPQDVNLSASSKLAMGVAHFLAGNPVLADAALSVTLAQNQAAGIPLEWQNFYSAVHADVCRALGDLERACTVARAGIEAGDRGGFRFQAALCRAALADALVQAGAPADEVTLLLADARALVEVTGGRSLLPRLHETESRLLARDRPELLLPGLREVEGLYRAIGALGHVDRIAHEISAMEATSSSSA